MSGYDDVVGDDDAVPTWPHDLAHLINEPTGYSAGYAAHHHPDFRDPTDDSYGREYEDLEQSYHNAGGSGPDFEEGVLDAANGISHKLDAPEDYHAYQAEEQAWRKRNRDSVNQQMQDKHNRLREQGDITDFRIHEGPEMPQLPGVRGFDYTPVHSPWKSQQHPEGSWEGCPTCNKGYGPEPLHYSDPDDDPDPFDPRIIGASRRTAGEDINLPPDQPHQDWQPKYKNHKPTVRQWHPPFGETHVKYHIYQMGGGRNPLVWGANHHGTYQGMETVDPPSGASGSITWPLYSNGYEPDQLGRFKTPEQAQAAAEQHFAENYGQPPKHDYDIGQIMDEHGGPQPHTRGLGDDEDYGHIFGAIKRIARARALQRMADAELSPPCPDCDQVAGFKEHPVSPAVKVCRNCDYPMLGYRVDNLLDSLLTGHDREIDELPEIDHPGLGKHGHRLAGDGMSWEDTMAHIDKVLAEGEPTKHNDWFVEPDTRACQECGNQLLPEEDGTWSHVDENGDPMPVMHPARPFTH